MAWGLVLVQGRTEAREKAGHKVVAPDLPSLPAEFIARRDRRTE